MKLLLIEDEPETSQVIIPFVEERFKAEVREVPSIQSAIEILESGEAVDFVVCDYRGGSRSLVKFLLSVSAKIPCIVFTDDKSDASDLFLIQRDAFLEISERNRVAGSLSQALERLKKEGFFKGAPTPDSDFLRIDAEKLTLNRPIRADIYVRLAENRYCRRFQASDEFDSRDLEMHFRRKGLQAFYVRKEDIQSLLESQDQQIDQLLGGAEPPPPAESREASGEALEIIRDVAEQVGFSPQVQRLTRKTVSLTLKSLGDSPDLGLILTGLQRQHGKYITSHSVMLAEIACSLAHRIGMGSAPVFFKLTLSAFLHDLSLRNNALAKMKSLEEVKASPGFSDEDCQAYRLHPLQAADFARAFEDIPPDVDTIILQHHELPDGSGFPRGLHAHQISPLACIFIMAHDLLDFFLESVPSGHRMNLLEAFLENSSGRYKKSTFKKIAESLSTGTPLSL